MIPAVVLASIIASGLCAAAMRAMGLTWRFSLGWAAVIGVCIGLSEFSNLLT